jgi:hypothetical protein
MNTPKDPIASEAQPLVNEQRRRLTKGGLAAPIVIGTLLSRPVLGAAHNCTISGQQSGNVSTHVQGTCSQLGGNLSHWKNNTWSDYTKGTVTDPVSGNSQGDGLDAIDAANSSNPLGSGAGARFRDISDNGSVFLDVYRRRLNLQNEWVRVNPTNTNFLNAIPMTLHEVLYLGGGMTNSPYVGLGREAVAALLNALDDTNYPNYPLTPKQVIVMFNACFSGGYEIAPGEVWNAQQVHDYFKSLHS